MKFETGQTSEPTSANISIVSRLSKRGPTMLRRRTRTTCQVSTQIHVSEMENVPESFVFSSKDPTCCVLLRAFARALRV